MKWPCYFSESDTTGEKEIEEFYAPSDNVDLDRFEHIGVLQSDTSANTELLEDFYSKIHHMVDEGIASKMILSIYSRRYYPGSIIEKPENTLINRCEE